MSVAVKALRGALIVIAGAVLGTNLAEACGTGKVLFEDKFDTLNPVWGFGPNVPQRSIGPNGLTYSLTGNDVSADRLNQAELYQDHEICTVYSAKVPEKSNTQVGINFWASDDKNMYSLYVYPFWGTYTILRYQNNKVLKPIPVTAADAIHKGTDVTNEIDVVLKGNKATLVINGTKVTEFSGHAPDGGGFFGFLIYPGKDDPGPSTVNLKSIQVREVAGQ
jgi:hypothetical protein